MRPEPPTNPNYPSAAKLPKWTPFVRAASPPMPGTTFYENSRYQVTLRQQRVIVLGMEVQAIRLGIANFDHSARHDWRDFQRIKNEILGPEYEAVEIHPPESRKVDPSNYYILFCFERPLLDVGMNERLVLGPQNAVAPQREFEP